MEPIRWPRRPTAMKKLLIAVAVLALGVLVAGVFVNNQTGSDDSMAADSAGTSARKAALSEVASEEMTRSQPLSDVSGDVIGQPALIRTGSIGIDTDDMTRDLTRVRAIATGLKGSVASESSSGSKKHSYAELTLRVPNADFDTAMADLGKLGTTTHRDISSDDVTTQVIDVEAKVRAKRAGVQSLERLMSKAKTVGEVMSVERELAQRQGELDSLVQQQRYLADQTSMSTITVSMSNDKDTTPQDRSGFIGGLHSGWHALGSVASGAATALGAVLPFVPVVLVIGVPVWWWLRKRRTRTNA